MKKYTLKELLRETGNEMRDSELYEVYNAVRNAFESLSYPYLTSTINRIWKDRNVPEDGGDERYKGVSGSTKAYMRSMGGTFAALSVGALTMGGVTSLILNSGPKYLALTPAFLGATNLASFVYEKVRSAKQTLENKSNGQG